MIDTARLILSPAGLDDFAPSAAMWAEAAVVRFIGGRPATREEVWLKTLRNIGHWTAYGFGLFTVRDRASGVFVGQTGLAVFERGVGARFDRAPEAAWTMVGAAHGKGLAAEATAAAHDWFDAAHPRPRTVCLIHPDKAPSLRLAARLGYRAFDTCVYRDAPAVLLERRMLDAHVNLSDGSA